LASIPFDRIPGSKARWKGLVAFHFSEHRLASPDRPRAQIKRARRRCQRDRAIAIVWQFLIVLTAARASGAQSRPLETLDPKPIGEGRMLLEGGLTYGHGEFYPLSGLTGNLWQIPLIDLAVGLGPIADFELSGGPYNHLAITDRRPGPLASLVGTADHATHSVEDIVIGTKIQLVPEALRRPAVGFRFAARLPNAKHDSGMGQDTTDFSSSVLAGKTVASVRVVGNVGLTIMSEPLDPAKQNDVMTYGFSLARPLFTRTELVGEVNGRWSTRNGIAPPGTESRGVVTVGGRFTSGAMQVDAAVRIGATSIDPNIGATVGVSYVFQAFSPMSNLERRVPRK
jgi:hypothetical protein